MEGGKGKGREGGKGVEKGPSPPPDLMSGYAYERTGRGRKEEERRREERGGLGGEALAVEPSHFSTGSDATGPDPLGELILRSSRHPSWI